MTRREFETKRPWKAAGVSRDEFEEMTQIIPQEIVEQIKEEAQAARFVEEIFGANALRE